MRSHPVAIGEPAPWFEVETDVNPRFTFDSVAGRYVIITFLGSASDPFSQTVLKVIEQHQDRFTGANACFFGVSNDPKDREQQRVLQVAPGIRAFWDFDNRVASAFGLVGEANGKPTLQRASYVLDTRLRCILGFAFEDSPEAHAGNLLGVLERMPPVQPPTRAAIQAPILVVPRIFEPDLCHRLIQLHKTGDREDSGFMRDVEGKTVQQTNHEFKKREDVTIHDEDLRKLCMHRIHDRLAPEVYKAYQFSPTRMERYLVAAYDADSEGHFNAHRDNTTKGTAHRRFAVSMNLNTGEYEGGYLRFPEFGSQVYEAPLGGAVVFSCSLLHEATQVTKGTRYAFLPFLYDEAAAKIREENLKFLASADAD